MLKETFKIVVILTGVIVCAGLFSCAKTPADADDNTELFNTNLFTGKVVDKTGKPISGVSVTSDPAGYSSATKSDGTFEIPEIEEGKYKFHLNHYEHLDTVTSEYEFGLNDTISIGDNFLITYKYVRELKGIIEDESGNPIETAGIIIEDQGQYNMANDKGVFTFKNIEPGTIKLLSAKQGKGSGTRELTLYPDEERTDIVIKHMLEGGTVSGTVMKDDDGHVIEKKTANPLGKIAAGRIPMAGAIVSAVGGALRDTADSVGYFELTGVPSGGAVELTVEWLGDTMQVAGIEVEERQTIELEDISVQKATVLNNIKLTPYSIKADESQAKIMLLVGIRAESIIDSVKWDLNRDTKWDTTTSLGRLEIPTPDTGISFIRVKAVDTSGNNSAVTLIRIEVVPVIKSQDIIDTNGWVQGFVSVTGTGIENLKQTPLVVALYKAGDENLVKPVKADVITDSLGSYKFSVPSGKYFLAAFLDLDSNGTFVKGEPTFLYRDTANNTSLLGASILSVEPGGKTTAHIAFVFNQDKNIEIKGTYTAEYTHSDVSGSSDVSSSLIVNTDSSFKETVIFDSCTTFQSIGDIQAVNKDEWLAFTKFQRQISCNDEIGPWVYYENWDTTRVRNLDGTIFEIRGEGMKARTGDDWIRFTKQNSETGSEDWLFDSTRAIIAVSPRYTGDLNKGNTLFLFVYKRLVPDSAVMQFELNRNDATVFLSMVAGQYRVMAAYDANGNNEFDAGDPYEIYVDGDELGADSIQKESLISVFAGIHKNVKLSFDDNYTLPEPKLTSIPVGTYVSEWHWVDSSGNTLITDTLILNGDSSFKGKLRINAGGACMGERYEGDLLLVDSKLISSNQLNQGVNYCDTSYTVWYAYGGDDTSMIKDITVDSFKLAGDQMRNTSGGIWVTYRKISDDTDLNSWVFLPDRGYIVADVQYMGPGEVSDDNIMSAMALSSDNDNSKLQFGRFSENPVRVFFNPVPGEYVIAAFYDKDRTDGSNPSQGDPVGFYKTKGTVVSNADSAQKITVVKGETTRIALNFDTTYVVGSNSGADYPDTWNDVFLDDFNRPDGLPGGLLDIEYNSGTTSAILGNRLLLTAPVTKLSYFQIGNVDSIQAKDTRVSVICSTTVDTGSGEYAFAVMARKNRVDSITQTYYSAGMYLEGDSIGITKSTTKGVVTLARKKFPVDENTTYKLELHVWGSNVVMTVENLGKAQKDTLRATDSSNVLGKGSASINGMIPMGSTIFFDDFKVESAD
ncbi:MAG: carboxypeptidase regulatory-like domain-containing protein [Fibrobacteria bacterium]|nr:carboxypeptidase regulatory-like domain-containing protein [Fibrobacteria bacterium]